LCSCVSYIGRLLLAPSPLPTCLVARPLARLQMGGIPLQSCSYEQSGSGRAADGSSLPAQGCLDLSLSAVEGGSSLAQVLKDMLPGPAGAASLVSISLHGGSLKVGPSAQVPSALAAVTSLHLARCDAEPPSNLAALLGGLLPQMPALRRLALANYLREGQVPAPLLSLTGLQGLTLLQLGLEALPPGAYLEGGQALLQPGCCCAVAAWCSAAIKQANSPMLTGDLALQSNGPGAKQQLPCLTQRLCFAPNHHMLCRADGAMPARQSPHVASRLPACCHQPLCAGSGWLHGGAVGW
jgi:hypothetical protein